MTVHARLPASTDRPRPYDLAWLRDGAPRWEVRDLPAAPALEAAVSILGRGAPVDTPGGPVPVEDLQPGDMVTTVEGPDRIDWIGRRDFDPSEPRPALFRIAPHAFGAGRPSEPVMLGEGALVLLEGAACRAMIGAMHAFGPVAAAEDGMSVTRLEPASPISLWGLACAGAEAVLVRGLPVSTWHPARASAMRLSTAGLEVLAALCPPIEGAGFGPARVPCLTLTEAREVMLG